MRSVPRLVYAVVVCVLRASIRPVDACGQEDPLQEDWRWVRYGVESGLPSERLLGLVESAGTLWVATDEGMAWFGGYRWNAITVPGLEMQAWVDQRNSDARPTRRMAPDYGGGVYLATSGPLYHVEQGHSEVIPLMFDGASLAVTSVATTGPDEVYVVAGPTVFAWDGNLITELPALPPEPLANDGLLGIAGGGGRLWAQRGRDEPLFELRDSSWVPRMTPASHGSSSAILEASPNSTILKSRGELGDEVWISGPTGAETHRGLLGTRHVDAASVSPRGDVVIAYRLGRIEVRRAAGA